MKNGLAIWHYPHRNFVENADYFAHSELESISILGFHMIEICKNEEDAARLAEIVSSTGVVLTVHHKLPRSHNEEDVAFFHDSVALFGEWQRKYGLISILSFDVSGLIRDNVAPYLNYVLEVVPECKVAVEDFGLTEKERAQIEYLKAEPRFGYLLDMGHLNIRMHGRDEKGYALFTTSASEGGVIEHPKAADFLYAFRSKEFPVFEIHLHNNDGKLDLHEFLEDGDIDMRELAQAIYDFGFDGVLTVETVPGDRYEGRREESDRDIWRTIHYWNDLYAACQK